MYQLTLSWSLGKKDGGTGGTKDTPTWRDVEYLLKELSIHAGSITLDKVHAPDAGPQSLQVLGDGGKYVLSLGELEDGDYCVRSFLNLSAEPGKVLVLGDLWDSRMVCSDINIVTTALSEFFETGDVSSEVLN